jgi:hypothetical protein
MPTSQAKKEQGYIMADILIDHLKKKSGEHGALKTLASQWDFDAKLIPKALQAVGNLFPHYSRHDESHSRQILVNIERLLGESVSLLTATDTWLILEAAYWHDIGMVVPKQDLSEELQSEEFQDFLASLRQSPSTICFALPRRSTRPIWRSAFSAPIPRQMPWPASMN